MKQNNYQKLKQIFSDYLKHKEINYLIKDTFEYLKLKKRYLNNKYLLKLFEGFWGETRRMLSLY